MISISSVPSMMDDMQISGDALEGGWSVVDLCGLGQRPRINCPEDLINGDFVQKQNICLLGLIGGSIHY